MRFSHRGINEEGKFERSGFSWEMFFRKCIPANENESDERKIKGSSKANRIAEKYSTRECDEKTRRKTMLESFNENLALTAQVRAEIGGLFG